MAKRRGMSVREFLAKKVDGLTLVTLAARSGVSYTTLHRHVSKGEDMRVATAKKLEAWSRGKIDAAKTLGVA